MVYVPRVPADYGHVVIAEIQGREPRGTVERMIEVASGLKRTADADVGATAAALLKLAESLKSPDLIRKQISKLSKAAADSKAEAQAAVDEQKKLLAANGALNVLRANHEREMQAKQAETDAACHKREQEAAAIEKAAKELMAKVQADAADVAKQKARLTEKLRLIEAA
jgi:chromosome segregation ATPase